MGNQKHTAEPWVNCSGNGNTERRIEHKGTGNNCVSLAVLKGPDRDANAARIEACVNILEGVPQEDLERILARFPRDRHARLRYLIAALPV